ncbi:unnamed protein product [Eruca vesicaria subsp. sativa]|uniref:F-box domain-containing protein n=1 Tax=Eruca vesicaria subsp. sativa TaxID=29727 RepID=A0ABC8LIB9_ERUVS|nr:unnamed protein product [Eruca vesicaria subsp. sativa]
MERNSTDKGKNIMKEENERERSIPDDVSEMILEKLPLKSVARFCSVKKRWAEMITSQHFAQRFLSQSVLKPRILFTSFISQEIRDGPSYQWFGSILQVKKPEVLRQDLLDHPRLLWDSRISIAQTVLGLVCCHNEKGRSMICNLSGGGMLMNLPNVDISKREEADFLLGFDQHNKQFKVLCVIWGPSRMEARVLSLLDGNNSWRKVDCKTPHIPVYRRLYLDGKVYYGAVRPENRKFFFVMCFDLQKEELSVIQVPAEADCDTLVNINNKLGIVRNYFPPDPTQRPRGIWIYESKIWSELPYKISLVGLVSEKVHYDCIGTIGTDLLVFAPYHVIGDYLHVVYYDASAGRHTITRINGVLPTFNYCFEAFLDYVENPTHSSIEGIKKICSPTRHPCDEIIRPGAEDDVVGNP